MAALTRDEILAARDVKAIPVSVPEWGGDGTVYVRMLSGAEADSFSARVNTPDAKRIGTHGIAASMLISDATGTRLFADDDADALSKKSYIVLERIVDAGMRVNGLRGDVVEEFEKNSENEAS